MGFWRWGGEPADVELATRVVTATAGDRVTVRGKLTLTFRDAQTKSAADAAADACAQLAVAIMREAASHVSLIGGESTVVNQIVQRLPAGMAQARTVELLSLHVVGDSTSSPALRRPSSGAIAAVMVGSSSHPVAVGYPSSAPQMPSAPPTVSPIPGMQHGAMAAPMATTSQLPGGPPLGGIGPLATASPIPTGSGAHLLGDVGTSSMPPRRVSSTRMRAPTAFSVPPGATPNVIGSALAPLVRDSAARILVGILRAYDLLVIRGLPLDESSPEVMSALVPTSEAPPGGFEGSRAQELVRWQVSLGSDIYEQLSREAAVFAVYLAYAAMIDVQVSPERAVQAVEATCAAGYLPQDSPVGQLGRYLHSVEPTVIEQLSANMIGILGGGDQTWAMARALGPLLTSLREDMTLAAAVIRQSAPA